MLVKQTLKPQTKLPRAKVKETGFAFLLAVDLQDEFVKITQRDRGCSVVQVVT